MNTQLVTVNNGIASTTSLIIAEQFERKHSHVLRSIEKVIGRYEIVPSFYLAGNGKQEKMYLLPKREALIVMPFIGGKKSIDGQERLVDAFLALEAINADHEARLSRLEQMYLDANKPVVMKNFISEADQLIINAEKIMMVIDKFSKGKLKSSNKAYKSILQNNYFPRSLILKYSHLPKKHFHPAISYLSELRKLCTTSYHTNGSEFKVIKVN